MSNTEHGGPAFPGKKRIYVAGYASKEYESVPGMSLRDYFAAKAMQGFVSSHPDGGITCDLSDVAEDAYAMADAMLKARQA